MIFTIVDFINIEVFSFLLHSLNEVQVKKICFDMYDRDGGLLQICREIYLRISTLPTNNFAFNDVSNLYSLILV